MSAITSARRTALRYLAAQAPGWALALAAGWAAWHWAGVPAWLCALVVALFILKDAVMYPFVRSAYEPVHDAAERLVGGEGVVTQALAPRGRVRIGGELWRAQVEDGAAALAEGTRVRVVAVKGLTIVVAAATPGLPTAPGPGADPGASPPPRGESRQ